MVKEGWVKKIKLGFKPGELDFLYKYQVSGHGETGVWYIEAVYDDRSDFWVSKWVFSNYQGGRWSVTYKRLNSDVSNELSCSFEVIKKEFLLAIDGVKKFAVKANSSGWIKTFDNAVDELYQEGPAFALYNSNLVVRKNYSSEALHMIAAAAKAWVFGGMGNWSDNYYGKELDEEHRKVTKALFYAVLKALICGVNSFPS